MRAIEKKIVFFPYGVLYHAVKAGVKLDANGNINFIHKTFGFPVEARGLRYGEKRKRSILVFKD